AGQFTPGPRRNESAARTTLESDSGHSFGLHAAYDLGISLVLQSLSLRLVEIDVPDEKIDHDTGRSRDHAIRALRRSGPGPDSAVHGFDDHRLVRGVNLDRDRSTIGRRVPAEGHRRG